MGLFDAVMTKT